MLPTLYKKNSSGKLMKYLLAIVFAMFLSTEAYSIDCSKHKIYCKIKSLRPKVDKKWAMRFSNIIYKKAKKYGQDPIRSVAIAMQESSLRQINRKQKILVMKEICQDGECYHAYATITGLTDLSIWQFHIETAAAYKVDFGRLQEDLEYATDFHFKLMKDKVKRCADLGDDAWTCYHSRTERLRKHYKKLVDRFYYED